MSSLKYADRVMMFVRDCTIMFYRSKLQMLFIDLATNTKVSLFFFLQKNWAFFLYDSEDFVEIQSVSSPSPGSRLRKGSRGRARFSRRRENPIRESHPSKRMFTRATCLRDVSRSSVEPRRIRQAAEDT